jgi:hypothetical protein
MIVLRTNHLKLAAATVAAVYRERWQIEQFLRALKQSLRIKTFVRTSGQRRAGADWDSTDCDAAGAVAADAEHVRLEFVQPGGAAAATAVCLQGLDDVAQPPFESPPELYAAEQLALEWA